MINQNELTRSIRFALIAGISSLALPVFAQDDAAKEDASDLDEIVVTGSRLKSQVEGAEPVLTIDASQFKATGETSVADVLRDGVFNSFGSFQGGSGQSGGAQGEQNISLRGLGSARTLILLNGRRMASSPSSGGASQNLSVIPFAAVDRIEILKDGASAIYGSDAIGGVINIILKQDFEGMRVSAQASRPSDEGGADNSASMVLGMNGEKGNIVVSAETFSREIVRYRDRDYFRPDISTRAGADAALAVGLLSPTGNPGSFIRLTPTGAPITATANPTFGGFQPFADCPATFGGTANPLSGRVTATSANGGVQCAFDFGGVAGYSNSLNRDNLGVNANYQINDSVNFFFSSTQARTKSYGLFAPTPNTARLVVAAASPSNPTRGTGLVSDVQVSLRLTPAGNRDSYVYENIQFTNAGFNGSLDLFGGANWETSVSHNRYKQDGFGYNYIIAPILQQEVTAGRLNPFDPASVAAVARRASTTITNDNIYRETAIDAKLDWSLFQIEDRDVPFLIGGEYRDQLYGATTDQQAQAGNVVGSAGSAGNGTRGQYAIYSEAKFPVLENLEIGAAVRFDSYSDFGTATSPKISLAYRPMDELLLRASFGQGFRAPSLDNLYSASGEGFPNAIDRQGCALVGIAQANCRSQQFRAISGGNRDLTAEESDNLSLGLVYSPMDDLNFNLDFYKIKVDGQISSLAVQEVLDREFEFCAGRAGCVFSLVDRTTNPIQPTAFTSLQNIASLETRGIDFGVNYALETDIGRWGIGFEYGLVDSFKTADAVGEQLAERVGYTGTPEQRAGLTGTWSMDAFDVSLGVNYVDGFKDCDAPDVGDAEELACGLPTIPSFTSVDLQAGWQTSWDGSLSVGVRNLFDRKPPFSNRDGDIFRGLHEDGFFSRTPFVNYTQNF